MGAQPHPRWTGHQARNQARLRRQLVQDLTVARRDRPAVDERIGHVPDRRLQPDRQLEIIVGRLQPSHSGDFRSPVLEIGRPSERLEQGQRPFAGTRPGHREGYGEASRLEREHLSVGVVQLQCADINHLTILSGYAPPAELNLAGAGPLGRVSLAAMTPETQYARLGELHLAYQVLGEGPPDLLLLDQWFTHVDSGWDVPPMAALRERLATFGRLIIFDKRGTGLSDPIPIASLPTLEEFMADIPAVLDTVGSERAAVIANIGGGILALPFAAAHPDRVSSLILVDCFARLLAAPDYPVGAPTEAVAQAMEQAERDTGKGIMLDLFAPSLAGDERLRRAWARYERAAATPGSTEAIVRLMFESDVREVLSAIRVPTLVIQRADVPGLVGHGRYLAEHIPNARYVELPGTDNLMWAGDQDAIVAEIQDFVTGVRPVPDPRRVLAAVLFTDIVGSTEVAARLGDARWEALLADHNGVVRRELDRFGGKEIKIVGDGLLATFDGPARAVRCAIAIRDGVRDLGLQIRAGIHVGEIEVLPDDIAGLGVHIGARVSAQAGAGEILVSSTVKDLVVGSGLEFEDRGVRALKGVPDAWRLFAVR